MDVDSVMNLDKDRIRKEFINDPCVGFSFTPMNDRSYPVTNQMIDCVICNPSDRVYSTSVDHSLFDIYKLLISDNHYDSLSYVTAASNYRMKSDSLDIEWIHINNCMTLACQTGVYPESNTFNLVNAPVSLVYVGLDGRRVYYYGTTIVFGYGVTSLPKELQWYLLANTIMMRNSQFGYSIATIVYKDTLNELCKEAKKNE